MNERVTWLLPVKNGMPYLAETLASIEAQTYHNWEVIAWDNGSTDDSLTELRKWIPSRLPGWIICNNPQGLGASLAKMVEMAQTEFCARIDADDVNHPERLEKQVSFMISHPDVGIVGAQVESIKENGSNFENPWLVPCDDAEIRWTLRWGNAFNHPTVLFRKSVVLKAGNYFDCAPSEDYDLWLRMSCYTQMVNLPERLVKYRVRSKSISASVTSWSEVNDEVARRNAHLLFPGMEAQEALDLRKKFLNYQNMNWLDLLKLYKVAKMTALYLGQEANYFIRTDLYKKQQEIALSSLYHSHWWNKPLVYLMMRGKGWRKKLFKFAC